jgi:tetratricopeptide (TPR) repeat protein
MPGPDDAPFRTTDFAPDPGDPGVTRTLGPPTAAPAGSSAVPGYEILGELGRGGMGVVYRARQVSLNREVALKMVLAGVHASATERRRFLTEAESAASIVHPGIVQVYEVGSHEDRPYFALEFCPGGSLADRLDGTPMPPARAVELVAAVARAVHAAHTAAVVHRDLKPGNILFAADGSPKVTDFGLARRLDSADGLTATGAVMGSPSYLSPEQAAGRGKEVGPATDIYALGAVLYECLTGRPPFRAATAVDTVMQVVNDEPVPPSRLVPRLARDAETICLKCLQKDPGKRYASAAALADDLTRFRNGEPITARPVPAWERAWKAAKRYPGLTAGVAVAAATLSITVLVILIALLQVMIANVRLEAERTRARNEQMVAELAREETEKERKKAEARLGKALDAIDRMMIRSAADRWARNPALQEERRKVLDEALAAYEGFAAEDSRHPEVRRRYARAHYRAGLAFLTLADYPRTDAATATARTLQEELVAEFPDEPGHVHDLAQTVALDAHARLLTGTFVRGKQGYERAVELARQAVASRPGEVEYRIALVEFLTYLGHFHTNDPLGPKLHAEAEGIARELSLRPDRPYAARLFLASSLLNLGETSRADAKASAAAVAEAESILADLDDEPPPTARLADVYDIARARVLVAQSARLVAAGKADEGFARFDEAGRLLDSLLAAQPRNFPILLQKYNALRGKRLLLVKHRREAEAVRALRGVVELADQMIHDSPEMTWLVMQVTPEWSQDLVHRVREGQTVGLEERIATQLKKLPPELLEGSYGQLVRYNIACAYAQAVRSAPPAERDAWVGKAIRELQGLEKAGYFRGPSRLLNMGRDPDLDPVRDRPEFKALLERVGAAGSRKEK